MILKTAAVWAVSRKIARNRIRYEEVDHFPTIFPEEGKKPYVRPAWSDGRKMEELEVKRKLCSVLCSICLILTLLPVHAAAEGESAAPATYTITFDANGGEGTMAPQTVTAGAGVTLNANAFTRKGYSFKGWATTADGAVSGYSDGQTLTSACIQKNMTLYAQWVQQTLAGTVTVTGNKDTGSSPQP